MLGIVLNKIPRNSDYYGGYHHYYYPYKHGEYYQEREVTQPQLPAEHQPLKLLPQTEAQPVEFYAPQDDALEKFFSDLQARERVDVYSPPQVVPATLNVITEPKRPKEVVQPVETPGYGSSELKLEDFQSVESPGYTIERYELEYWYDRDKYEKDDD